jgi:hypothetical protein
LLRPDTTHNFFKILSPLLKLTQKERCRRVYSVLYNILFDVLMSMEAEGIGSKAKMMRKRS